MFSGLVAALPKCDWQHAIDFFLQILGFVSFCLWSFYGFVPWKIHHHEKNTKFWENIFWGSLFPSILMQANSKDWNVGFELGWYHLQFDDLHLWLEEWLKMAKISRVCPENESCIGEAGSFHLQHTAQFLWNLGEMARWCTAFGSTSTVTRPWFPSTFDFMLFCFFKPWNCVKNQSLTFYLCTSFFQLAFSKSIKPFFSPKHHLKSPGMCFFLDISPPETSLSKWQGKTFSVSMWSLTIAPSMLQGADGTWHWTYFMNLGLNDFQVGDEFWENVVF